ncbi:helix-turn-helix transcriptional regulator [Vulgatibacter sp.]|uniref:helix-turn-helix transcriptional regulator n=1 Tax=Vulgatibacter sp. TaxID=1971226 RepID=UPI003569D842
MSASPLFAAIADREPLLGGFLGDCAVRAAADGDAWLDDGWLVGRASVLTGSVLVLVQLFGPAVVRARVARLYRTSLSGREGECLALALEGAENGAIAGRLGVRPETVKVHLRNAYRKLNAGGRAEILARLVASP